MVQSPMNDEARLSFGSHPAPLPMFPASEESERFRPTARPLFLQYLNVVRRWKWAALGIVATALAVGLIVTLLTPLSYSAAALVEISRAQKNVTNVQGLEENRTGEDQEFYETQYSLLQARSLATRVARRLNLAREDAFFAAHGVEPEPPLAGVEGATAGQRQQDREQQVVELLLDNVAISPVRRSSLVQVEYTSRSPTISSQVANVWVEEFINAEFDRQVSSSNDAREFLEGRLNALRTRLEESERAVVRFAAANEIFALGETRDAEGRTQSERTLASSSLEAYNKQLSDAIAARVQAQSRLASADGMATVESLTSPAISEMRKKRADLAAEQARLLTQFEPNYPPLQALQEQIRNLDESMRREVAQISQSRSRAYQEALQQERAIRAEVNRAQGELTRQLQQSIQYNIFRREADTNRELYDALLQRYKEIGVAGLAGASNIAIIDRAEIPDIPSAPSLPRNLAIAFLLGIVLAAIVAAALELLDEGVRDPTQVSGLLGVPLLGYTPAAADAGESLADPKSELAEAYFSAQTTLSFATSHGLPRSFMVTSTVSGEGKSTTAFALALAIGRAGKKALLVDADLRSPSQHHFFDVPNDSGLSNLLAGDERHEKLIKASPYAGVSYLVAGPPPPNPAELLSDDRLKELVALFSSEFDTVILDSAPVLGLADALLLGRSSEGCLFVVKANSTRVRGVRRALDRIKEAGIPLFGAMLTSVKNAEAALGYGYSYGGDYKYGSTE